ncbi:hypothetical protein [Gordonia malaquae]|uniref:hypothetical protein n=1 Tax=Gordonia malaquae TaxID=410332 RepID=UPI003015AFD2
MEAFELSRRERKALKDLKAQRAAEEKLAAEDARQAKREQAKADWDAMSSSEKSAAFKILAAIVILVVVVFAILAACGGDKGNDTNHSDSATSDPVSSPSSIEDAPIVTSLPISFAEEKYNIDVDAVDVGPSIVDGVDHERGIFDRSNWRIVAYCPRMVDNTVKVGVIKSDEHAQITAARQGTSISDNSLTYLLDCPL